MFRTLSMALALFTFTASLTLISLGITPSVNAASIPDAKSCPHAVRTTFGGKIATQVGPQPINRTAGSLTAADPGTTKLNAGCQPLGAPLPPQNAGKTFEP